MSTLARTVDPAEFAVGLDEVKAYARIDADNNTEDALLLQMIAEATDLIEGPNGLISRTLLTQTWQWKIDEFPSGGATFFEIPLPPLQSISSITYVDTAGATQTWDASEYVVDTNSSPGRVELAYQATWPTTRDILNAVTITFVSGYGADRTDVPTGIRRGIAMLVTHWFDNRNPVVFGGQVSRIPRVVPLGIMSLLNQYRVVTFK